MEEISLNDKVSVELTFLGANYLNQMGMDYKAGDIYTDQLWILIMRFGSTIWNTPFNIFPFKNIKKVVE